MITLDLEKLLRLLPQLSPPADGTLDFNVANLIVCPAWPPEEMVKYPSAHVEPLLDQAADLFDRCVRDRAEWNALFEKWLNNHIELMEFASLDVIQDQEVKAGNFDVPGKLSDAESKALDEYTKAMSSAAETLQRALDGTGVLGADRKDKARTAQAAQGWLDTMFQVADSKITGQVEEQGYGITPKRYPVDFSVIWARELFDWNCDVQTASAQSQCHALEAAHSYADLRKAATRTKADYDVKDAQFKRQRREVLRQSAITRLRASTSPNGALNFGAQMESIRIRYINDFQEALSKILAAYQGLQDVFGLKYPLPRADSEEERLKLLDECVVWTRSRINDMVRRQRNDESHVCSISLKQKMGQYWGDAVKSGTLRFPFSKADLGFPDPKLVRLRGVSSFVSGKGLWSLLVDPPAFNGSTRSFNIGRVRPRSQSPVPELYGTVATFNISPFGNWTVTLPETSVEGESRASIEDLYLDFTLVHALV